MGMKKQHQAHGTKHRDQDQQGDVFIHGRIKLLGVPAPDKLFRESGAGRSL
jgi:hypothetical protein